MTGNPYRAAPISSGSFRRFTHAIKYANLTLMSSYCKNWETSFLTPVPTSVIRVPPMTPGSAVTGHPQQKCVIGETLHIKSFSLTNPFVNRSICCQFEALTPFSRIVASCC
jgi:hypothetical protein